LTVKIHIRVWLGENIGVPRFEKCNPFVDHAYRDIWLKAELEVPQLCGGQQQKAEQTASRNAGYRSTTLFIWSQFQCSACGKRTILPTPIFGAGPSPDYA
jgi:hypothetical protein